MLTKEECIEALNYLASGQCSYCWKKNGDKVTDFECHESYELLVKLINEHFELVEKATPKKYGTKTVKAKSFEDCEFDIIHAICPTCGYIIDDFEHYAGCPYCLQAIDWSEEDVD